MQQCKPFNVKGGYNKMDEIRTKYGEYLIPAFCFVTGMLIGFLLSPVKKGKITLFSNNMIGSKNGSKNSAADMLLGGHKN